MHIDKTNGKNIMAVNHGQ